MKKILFAFLMLAILTAPAFALDTYRQSATLTGGGLAADNTTVTFTLRPGVPKTMYLYVPTITSATIALSCSVDGTNFGTMATNYSATALIDFSYAATTGGKVLRLPDISPCRFLKITSGAAQVADRTFVIFGN